MENGIVLLDKDAGVSSRDVDDALEKLFHTKKVGHLGTLDPFATGLLVIGLNKGTKFLPYLDDSKKSYIATLKLGFHSSTGDPEGEITAGDPVPELTKEGIAQVLYSFVGKSEQLPPMTSAIKVNGEALYKAAHRGEEVERKKRAIEIYSINLISFEKNEIVFTTTVSRGTYIRVLGEDIAQALKSVGYLTSLRRLSIGDFRLDLAKKLSDLTENDVMDPTLFIHTMKHIEIDEADLDRVKNGAPMTLAQDYGEKVLLVLHENAIAVYARTRDAFYHSERGLF
jgi:tRNA pseudouridine55 synthase